MSVKLYSEELKIEAVKQIMERYYPLGRYPNGLGPPQKFIYKAYRPLFDPLSRYIPHTNTVKSYPYHSH